MVMSDAYHEGYEAFGRGLTIDENPHADDIQQRDRWTEGWEDAKIDKDSDRRSICTDRT